MEHIAAHNISKKKVIPRKIPNEIRADNAGRLTLGKAFSGELFKLEEQSDGTILLIPAKIIPAREIWFISNQDKLAALDRAMKRSKEGKSSELDLEDLANL